MGEQLPVIREIRLSLPLVARLALFLTLVDREPTGVAQDQMTSVLDLNPPSAYDRGMTSDLDSGGESSIERRRRRRFRARIWVGAAGYLLASYALYQWGPGNNSWRPLLAALPLLFVVWNVVVIALRVRQMDEYQIKLFFPGLAVGFAVSTFAAITEGTLGAAGFSIPNGGWIVAIVGILAWQTTNLVTGAPKA